MVHTQQHGDLQEARGDRARAPPQAPQSFTNSMLRPKFIEKAALLTVAGSHMSFLTCDICTSMVKLPSGTEWIQGEDVSGRIGVVLHGTDVMLQH